MNVIDAEQVVGMLFGRPRLFLDDSDWCLMHGVSEDALERIGVRCGTVNEPETAAKNAFQLGIEVRDPLPPPPASDAGDESEFRTLEREILSHPARRISDREICVLLDSRDWLLSDGDWCWSHGVSEDALEAVCDSLRGLEPGTAAVCAFRCAITLRRSQLEGGASV